MSVKLLTAGLMAAATLVCGSAASAEGYGDNPSCMRIHMRPGAVSILLQGRLTQRGGGYCYRFRARAGQMLTWTLRGPATRQVITYPDGNADGPGIPGRIPLQMTGDYEFSVSPNLMADGAYGRFWLRLTIR